MLGAQRRKGSLVAKLQKECTFYIRKVHSTRGKGSRRDACLSRHNGVANQFLQGPAKNAVNESNTCVESHEVILHLPDGLSRRALLIFAGEQYVVRPRSFLRLPLLSEFRFSLFLKVRVDFEWLITEK